MAEQGSRVRALFGPVWATFKAAVNSEDCGNFAKRKIKDNKDMLGRNEISQSQAADYLTQLRSMTNIYGGTQCSSIVARELDMLNSAIAKR